MNRRDFLRGLALAFAAPVLAKVAIQESAKVREIASEVYAFDASAEYGNAIQVTTKAGLFDAARDMLLENARHYLPPGTRFYVMQSPAWAQGLSDPLNEYEAFAWYYSPKELSAERRANVVCEAIA